MDDAREGGVKRARWMEKGDESVVKNACRRLTRRRGRDDGRARVQGGPCVVVDDVTVG